MPLRLDKSNSVPRFCTESSLVCAANSSFLGHAFALNNTAPRGSKTPEHSLRRHAKMLILQLYIEEYSSSATGFIPTLNKCVTAEDHVDD